MAHWAVLPGLVVTHKETHIEKSKSHNKRKKKDTNHVRYPTKDSARGAQCAARRSPTQKHRERGPRQHARAAARAPLRTEVQMALAASSKVGRGLARGGRRQVPSEIRRRTKPGTRGAPGGCYGPLVTQTNHKRHLASACFALGSCVVCKVPPSRRRSGREWCQQAPSTAAVTWVVVAWHSHGRARSMAGQIGHPIIICRRHGRTSGLSAPL